MRIKAIETEYRGHQFRSGLEARWAIFFDEAGILWEYEVEGYEMSNGERYLPDFWLPEVYVRAIGPGDQGLFVEVKPTIAEYERVDKKLALFAEESGKTVLTVMGIPRPSCEGTQLDGHFEQSPHGWDNYMKFVDCPKCRDVGVIYGAESNYYYCTACHEDIPSQSVRLKSAANIAQTHRFWRPKKK